MIQRDWYHRRLETALGRSQVVMMVGPRQCGKSTLARSLRSIGPDSLFDLEDPAAAAALAQPMTVLRDLRGLVVID